MNQAYDDRTEYERRIKEFGIECERKVKEADDRAEEIQQRCAKDNEKASRALEEAEKYRSIQQTLVKDEQKHIDILAEKKIADRKERLKATYKKEEDRLRKEYKMKHASREGFYVMTLFFCEAFLVIQAVCSDHFRHDLLEILGYLQGYVTGKWQLISAGAERVTGLIDVISNGTVAALISGLLMIVTGILLTTIFYILPVVVVVYGGMAYIKSDKFDSFNKWTMVLSGIFFVASASGNFFRSSTNLLFCWILVQMAVPVLRFILFPLFFQMLVIQRYE